MTTEITKAQYFLLKDVLERTDWQLEGSCEDIDCDKYMYLDCLKKSQRVTVLEHGFSCIPGLKKDYKTLMALLDHKKFKKLRYEKCGVCKKLLDTLDKKNPLTSFFSKKPTGKGKFKGYEWRGARTHKRCQNKLKVPEGFELR